MLTYVDTKVTSQLLLCISTTFTEFAEKNITTILISCMLAKTLNTKMKT